MLEYLRKRPMIIAAVGCSVSAVCGFYFEKACYIVLAFIIPTAILNLIKRKGDAVIICVLICVMTVSCIGTVNKIKAQNALVGSKVQAEFVFCDISQSGNNRNKSLIEIINCKELKRGTKLYVWHSLTSLENGDRASGTIRIREHSEDYKAQNYGLGVYISGNLSEIEPINSSDPVLSLGESVRNYIRKSFFGNMSYSSASTMSALVFGDMSYFTNEFYNNVKAAGVAHVMVVSGMHLSIIVSIALRIIEQKFYNPFVRAFIMIFVVLVLCTVCGFQMSIVRASVTYVIMALGLILNQPYSGENALGAAVVLILIGSPFAVLNVAFQLSVLSTFGILAVSLPVCSYLKSRFDFKIPLLFSVSENIIMTLSALLLTLPVTIYVFGFISNFASLSNLLISSAVDICLISSIIALLLNLIFPIFGEFLFFIPDLLMRYINFVINYLGTKECAITETPQIWAYISVGVIFLVFYILSACKKRIDMVKLEKMNLKIISERKSGTKWQSFLKKH